MKLLIAAGALALPLLLAGCVNPSPAPSPKASSTAAPTPTPTVEPITAPTPGFDLSCSDLASNSDASAAIGEPAATDDPAEVQLSTGWGIPRTALIEQLGGIECSWSNGTPAHLTNEDPQRHALTISAIPNADDKWNRYADAYGYKGDDFYYCYDYDEADPTFFCGYFALINHAWVEVYIDGADLPGVVGDDALKKELRPLVDQIGTQFAEADKSTEEWAPPSDTAALPTECENFVSSSVVTKALGAAETLVPQTYTDGPQVDQTLSMDSVPLATSCLFLSEGSESGAGNLSALPGGQWAWERYKDVATTSGDHEPLTLNLEDGDEAFVRCTADESRCSADLIIDRNWIVIEAGTNGVKVSANMRSAVTEIAEAVVGNLTTT